MTIKSFADYLGISPSTLFEWENGAFPRDATKLKVISNRLQLPLETLLFNEELARHL